jgi:hypothetical protein
LIGTTRYVLPEDGDRIQSPKRCVLKYKQDGVLDADRTMDNVHKHNICINVPLSQTFRCFVPHFLKYGRWTNSKNLAILSVIHYRRKPGERKSSLNVSIYSLLQRFLILYFVTKKYGVQRAGSEKQGEEARLLRNL